jgi:hypothetical protein
LELDTEGTTRTATLGDLVVESRALDAAALFRADLVSIKAVENDYRTYRLHVGTDYEAIHPVPDSYVEAVDANGRPISALALWFRCDLPFPFTDYSCHLRILNRFAEDGTARTDIYSTSGDFHFLAGRDAFLPVETSAGELVACLVVRHFGFDLDGVPDGPAQRIEALRGSLGNLERKAERHHERSDRGFELSDLALTRFRVLGAR